MGKTRLLSMLLIACLTTSCATTARYTLENRFQAIGIPEGTATCMVDDLDESLSDNDMTDLAKYTLRISRASSTMGAIQELLKIDNPRAVTAIGKAGFTCVTGFLR